MQATGVWGSDVDNACKLLQGSGLNTTLKTGYALVRGHMYYNSADLTVAFTAGGASARIDLLVLRLDPTANTIKAIVLPGALGAGVAPAPTQTDAGVYDLPIAEVTVAAGSSSITTANIKDVRQFMGHIFGDWTTANRPVSPRDGQPGYNLTTNAPEYWNGSAWVNFSPSSFTISQISDIGTASVANALKINGRQIFVQSGTPTGAVANDLWFW
jgi:hypothetical protein